MAAPFKRAERTAEEIASLAERMGYMQALRATFAVVVLVSAFLAPDALGASLTDVVFLTAAYLVLSATIEGLRRSVGKRGIAVVEGMLLVDAVYLALVGYATGGTQSPLRFLVYLHLIGVTLLASYRTGMKIAVWHALLFFVTFYAQASGLLPALETPDAPAEGISQPSIFNVVALLLVATGTMAFSSLNERELRRRKIDLEALNETARKLENVTDPADVASILVEGARETLGFDRGLVLAAPPGNPLTVMAYRGPGEAPSVDLKADDEVTLQAWEEHETQLVKRLDAEKNPRLDALLPGAENLAIVPLFAEGDPIGVLVAEHTGRIGFRLERRVFSMISQFASHAALALRNTWLLQEVQRMADTDELTGIPNRRTFEIVLSRELSRAKRNGEQVTLAMIDIDHFKKLNDTHGHPTGDEVLRQTGRALAVNCRGFDTPARYGGEEFAIIMPSCSVTESLPATDRLRIAISKQDLPVPVTASAGVATFPTHASDAAGLIKAADEALYESKRAGRDRVTRSRRATASSRSPQTTPE